MSAVVRTDEWPRRRQSRETVDEIEFGISGIHSGPNTLRWAASPNLGTDRRATSPVALLRQKEFQPRFRNLFRHPDVKGERFYDRIPNSPALDKLEVLTAELQRY